MKHTLIHAAACACLVTLSACKPKPEVPPTDSSVETPAAAAALVASSPRLASAPAQGADAFASCLEAAAKTKSVDDTENGLQAVQFLMTCSENYLSSYPSGAHGEDALRLWHKGIAASNEILRGIEGRMAGVTQDPAEVQQRMVSRENIQRLAKANGYMINRAFQYYTIQTLLVLYEGMKASGIKMESAVPWFNQMNLSRKNTGVWELAMDGSYDEGNFIVVREFGRKDPLFNVAGFGVYAPNVAVTDADQIDTRGWYGPACKVKVTAENESFNYGCDAFLSGQVIDQMVKDLRKGLEDAMVRKEKEGAASQRSNVIGDA
jgi:hypothetical protein